MNGMGGGGGMGGGMGGGQGHMQTCPLCRGLGAVPADGGPAPAEVAAPMMPSGGDDAAVLISAMKPKGMGRGARGGHGGH